MCPGKLRIFLPVVSIALLGMTGVAVLMFIIAQHFRLQLAELRLMPVRSDVYLADNAALAPPAGMRVVFFGDSRISGWVPRPRADGREMIWRGIGGETTAQMVHRFAQDVIALQPGAVVIQAGINDLVAGNALGTGERTAAQTVENLRHMAMQARASSIDVYLLTILKPSTAPLWQLPFWSGDIYSLVDSTNQQIRDFAGDGITVLEADRKLTGASDRMPGRLSHDTLHLNASGYELLNGLVEGALGTDTHAVQ
jgi:lysophospholipase L1-like esterase